MWLIVPLIFVLSWRTTRRFGQAFNETVAWVVGYFVTAGVLWLTDFSGLDLVEARPNSPGALIAVLGGFVGMFVSRWRWKRRGGHLEPRRDWLKELARGAGRLSATRGTRGIPAQSAHRGQTATNDFATVTGRMLGRAAAQVFVPELRRRNRWFRALRALVAEPKRERR
ncbi:hypothetical protein NET03_12950 [Thermomicrobium sp. CFH 73360]|uniref:hypothetical protein n=1 Tax=Thermomicrobium sp. CFH 73360 TaxID=2951987 RepID=UPI0020771A1B|nr:hypothetical protein [Thermomicrobium sp. CFH 73360]MCM8747430.1 hypothetical protein [Thermomicrobium sp. CFH 73360]